MRPFRGRDNVFVTGKLSQFAMSCEMSMVLHSIDARYCGARVDGVWLSFISLAVPKLFSFTTSRDCRLAFDAHGELWMYVLPFYVIAALVYIDQVKPLPFAFTLADLE